MFSNLQKNIHLLESNKETILTMWMNYEIVQTKLTRNSMNIKFFKEKFANKVFDFAMSVVSSKNTLGDCPVIGVMLILFKKKNIPLSDIFMICVHFKNALLHFAQKNNILDDTTLQELSMLMDYNFEGVINEYVLLYYNDSLIPKVQTKTPSKNIRTPTLKINECRTSASTSAELYFEEVHIDMDMIEELSELESDTLSAIDSSEELCQRAIIESANLFHKYANVLATMMEFDELEYTLKLLSELLENVDFNEIDKDTQVMVDIYLKAIISDLQSWRMAIFITKHAEDIHYLDKTLLSSIAQIQMTLMPQVEETEDEIEFF